MQEYNIDALVRAVEKFKETLIKIPDFAGRFFLVEQYSTQGMKKVGVESMAVPNRDEDYFCKFLSCFSFSRYSSFIGLRQLSSSASYFTCLILPQSPSYILPLHFPHHRQTKHDSRRPSHRIR
ncbi:hypothetical protein K469DRAFT_94571 [Zopfia rhizophila CBS 207.26]|uniref:Uncharacterized protein n=1 Tax=Zopfia rhizophila CBS 207.26 TaxID=1314779 RepID=A0A6A6E8R8_9PEZI|nr:hypothetical protein K469DRAFT_94571 [Zopfia rhizophila CBS 207.26]